MLRNRIEQDAPHLHGVNLVVEDFKLQLGWFESLQNWVPVPDELYSMQKKRGVATLGGDSSINIPVECTENIKISMDCVAEECPGSQFAEAEYDGHTGFSGPFIRGANDSTVESASLLAAIYVQNQTAIVLTLFDAAPITDLDVVIDAVAHTLNVGDVLRIESTIDDPNEYTVKVNNVPVIGPVTIAEGTLPSDRTCTGFIEVDNVTGTYP